MEFNQERDGSVQHLAIMMACGGAAAGAGALALGHILNNPKGVQASEILRFITGLLMLAVSIVATANGGRECGWRFTSLDALFGVSKGTALVVLLTVSDSPAGSSMWVAIAGIYGGAISLHLGHVRRVMNGHRDAYRAHLRSAQQGALVLTMMMGLCVASSRTHHSHLVPIFAPTIAALLAIAALRAESLVTRGSR